MPNDTALNNDSLTYVEWWFLTTFIFLLSSLSIISFWIGERADENIETYQMNFPPTVTILGAVEYPGSYGWAPQDSLAHIIKRAEVQKEGYLAFTPLKETFTHSKSIFVPTAKKITIYVEGEVEKEGFYEIDRGIRYCEIPRWIKVTERADMRIFRKKRLLREGEVIKIMALR